jgi:hypothetical protein
MGFFNKVSGFLDQAGFASTGSRVALGASTALGTAGWAYGVHRGNQIGTAQSRSAGWTGANRWSLGGHVLGLGALAAHPVTREIAFPFLKSL